MQRVILCGKFDVVTAVKSNSRDRFATMPKPKRIGDKRDKQPRYKRDWRTDGY